MGIWSIWGILFWTLIALYLGRPLWAWLAKGERFKIRRHRGLEWAIVGSFVGVFVVSMFLVGLGSFTGGSSRGAPIIVLPTDGPSRTSAQSSEASALDLMQTAFAGGYSRSEIEQRMDIALVLYDEEITEEIYSRAGSALVALSNEFGPSEMEILDYMIRSYVAGVSLTFAEAAAIATAFLASGDQ